MSDLQPADTAAAYTPARPVAYDRLTYDQLALVLRLHNDGKPQTYIAEIVGCSQPAISQALKRLGTDSTDLAKHHFKAKAYRAARRVTAVMEKGKDDDAIKASRVILAASGVIEGLSNVQVGVQVIIGTPQQAALDATSITVMSGQGQTGATVDGAAR